MPDLPSQAPFEWRAADAKALADAFETSHATSTPAPASWSGYAENLSERFNAWLAESIRPVGSFLGPSLVRTLEWIVVIAAGILLVMIVVRIFQRFGSVPPALRLQVGKRLEQTPELNAAQFRTTASGLLDTGDLRKALTSIWWWFASAALKDRPEAAMTTYEVLSRSRRADLRRHAQTLDRLRFDARDPAEAEVRQLFRAFEATL